MVGAGHFRLHGIGLVARSDPEARSPTSLHCRLVRRGSASAAHASPRQHQHARTRRARTTDDDRRRTTRRAVRRSGLLEDCSTGEHGAYAHRFGGGPSLRPLSPLPCPCKAAAPKGPAFCFLNYHGTLTLTVLSSTRLHTLTVLRDRHSLARFKWKLGERSSALLNSAAADVVVRSDGRPLRLITDDANVTKIAF